MENKYHTKAELSDYIDREMKLISPFFRLTKIRGLILSILLVTSFTFSIYKLVILGLSLEDPFAHFSFSIPFIILLIELDCIICIFPSFIKQEFHFLQFILLSLVIVPLFNKDFITSLISLWMFISLKLAIPTINRAKIKYAEYKNKDNNSHDESIIYQIPELTESIDYKNGYAPPIDNSNLFKKKSIYDEEIDLVDMDKVFKKK